MILLGLFLLCAVIYSYHLLVDSLEPTMRLSQELDQKLIAKIDDQKIRDALSAGAASDWEGLNLLIEGARAVIIGCGLGFAILSFYTAALSWRAYELASTKVKSPE